MAVFLPQAETAPPLQMTLRLFSLTNHCNLVKARVAFAVLGAGQHHIVPLPPARAQPQRLSVPQVSNDDPLCSSLIPRLEASSSEASPSPSPLAVFDPSTFTRRTHLVVIPNTRQHGSRQYTHPQRCSRLLRDPAHFGCGCAFHPFGV